MSQHCFDTVCAGVPVSILMGWDRPLQGYFMVIEAVDSEKLIYSNLNDAALAKCMGLPRSLDHFLNRLHELGLQAPDRMLKEIQADAAANAGNRFVVYDSAGVITTDC